MINDDDDDVVIALALLLPLLSWLLLLLPLLLVVAVVVVVVVFGTVVVWVVSRANLCMCFQCCVMVFSKPCRPNIHRCGRCPLTTYRLTR